MVDDDRSLFQCWAFSVAVFSPKWGLAVEFDTWQGAPRHVQARVIFTTFHYLYGFGRL